MAQYFFSLQNGVAQRDTDGQDCVSLVAAKEAAQRMAYDFARNKNPTELLGVYISVTDETGAEVFRMPLSVVDDMGHQLDRRR